MKLPMVIKIEQEDDFDIPNLLYPEMVDQVTVDGLLLVQIGLSCVSISFGILAGFDVFNTPSLSFDFDSMRFALNFGLSLLG